MVGLVALVFRKGFGGLRHLFGEVRGRQEKADLRLVLRRPFQRFAERRTRGPHLSGVEQALAETERRVGAPIFGKIACQSLREIPRGSLRQLPSREARALREVRGGRPIAVRGREAARRAAELGFIAWPFVAAAAIFGLFAWRLYDVDGPERALLRGMVASVLIAISGYAVTIPSLPALFPSAMIANEERSPECPQPQFIATRYYEEPSLIFLLGTDFRFSDPAGAADFLKGGACRFALVDQRNERNFGQRAEAIGLRYSLRRRIEGYNISNGRPVVLAVFGSVENQ